MPLDDARFTALANLFGIAAPAPGGNVPDASKAAVALLLRQAPSLEVLLIKRAEVDGDPWSGQMALPGGRWQVGDDSLLGTAVRETEEETGVALDRTGRLLGPLERAAPWTSHVPPLTVHPFVFGVPGVTEATTESPEVQSVHWASLESLREPANAGVYGYLGPQGQRSFPCFHIDGQVVWGLTYRILERFLELTPDGL